MATLSELIEVNKVIVYYQCCECKNIVSMPLKDHLNIASLCDECTYVENFMEMIGIVMKIKCDGCHELFEPNRLYEAYSPPCQWKIDDRCALQCYECHDHWIGHC